MAQTKSAIKELRKTKTRTLHNKALKANLNYLEKKFLKTLVKDKNEAKKIYIQLQKSLDKAVKVNLIKKNNASRKKSRLAKRMKTK
ncbi:MAG: 30S ribosomal protein S20 [Patescibacteria group bacterium]|nr:30S ribosomal protein S20 [Patescibacteria group bacterium]MDD5121209.1 30S ribosomal protein S20 [Patescibacteria group bacterium]MDD5221762.1 30S ribosomal protein S20 [Patescibacteria group bacterium]MDD5395872.1 30S ribosomal protein S20 [Patescibacteria group bacterium]